MNDPARSCKKGNVGWYGGKRLEGFPPSLVLFSLSRLVWKVSLRWQSAILCLISGPRDQTTKRENRAISSGKPGKVTRSSFGKNTYLSFHEGTNMGKVDELLVGRALQNNYQCDSDVPQIRWTFVFREQMYFGYRETSEKGSKTENCNSVFHR